MKAFSYFALSIILLCISSEFSNGDSLFYDKENQSLETLFLHPGYSNLKIEYDINWDVKASGTQQYKEIVTIKDNVWTKELVAPAGVLFPTDQHQVQTVDFNKKEWKINSKLHPKVGFNLPFTDESYASLRVIAFSPLTTAEIFGLEELAPVFKGSFEFSQFENIDDGMNQLVLFNETLQTPFAVFNRDSLGRLKNAVYWESSKPETREIMYGEYKTQEATNIVCPETVTLKRYCGVGITELSEDNLTEEVTLSNIVVSTDF